MDFGKMIEPITWDNLPPEFITSVIAMLAIIILSVVIYFNVKKFNPLEKPHGFMHLCEILINFADDKVEGLMGKPFKNYVGYIITVGLYIFLGFFIGMIGIPNFLQPHSSWYLEALPNPFTNLAMPLSIALVTFAMTHFTAMKCKKWRYFERYVEPIPLFLPINLVTMWSDVLSLTLRLFGNALAGYCIVTLIYVGIGSALPPAGSLTGLALTPLLAPFAHLYFDLFDGAIQLAVFTMLTMISISNEYVSVDELELEKQEKIEQRQEKKARKLERKNKKAEAFNK